MAADPGGAAWQDFGQRVDLTARIREILRDYSEGTSVFKELVQVAQQCAATFVTIMCKQH
jgi:sacsin